jgi:hypothetical protein
LRFDALFSGIRRVVQQVAMFSDVTSCLRYIRMRPRRRPINEIRLSPLALRVRGANGQRVYCRPGTTDLSVLYETFCGRYHLPPLT